jgi:integrase
MDARLPNADDVAHKLPKRREQRDKQVPGLRLRIGKRRSTWVLICRMHGGHASRYRLGHYPAMSVKEARAEALRVKAALAAGKDPAVRASRGAQTFGAVCEDYFIDCQRRGLRRAREAERDTRRDLARWWHRPIDRIGREDVLHLVRNATDNRTAYAAHHAFSYCSRLFGWAVENGIVAVSPCYGLRPSRIIGPKPPRERVLTDDELRALWNAAGKLGTSGVFVKILLLLGQRRGEVAGMRWSEIHGNLWVIPTARMKMKMAHTVPLVPEVRALLAELPRFGDNDLVFGRRIGGFHYIKRKLDVLMPGVPPFVLHDIRRSVRTGLSALRIPAETAERTIGHGPTGLQRVYDRHDFLVEKTQALLAWATHLMRIVN